MEKKLGLGVLLIVFGGIVLLSGCAQQQETNTGNFVLAIKDNAPDMSLIGKVELTVSNISIHNAGTDSWITLSDQTQQFSLLELQNVQALAANKDLNAGTYNQLRFSIDRVSVEYNGTTQEAKLPSNTLKLSTIIEIDANKTSIATLDFDLNRSFHLTGNGKIIMLPVIKVVSERDSNVEVDYTNKVSITVHGIQTDNSEIGTDLSGNTGNGVQVSQGKELEIGDNGRIREKQNEGD